MKRNYILHPELKGGGMVKLLLLLECATFLLKEFLGGGRTINVCILSSSVPSHFQ